MSDVAQGASKGDSAGEDADALRERLSQIDELPLGERADEFAQLHGQLQSLLEGNDASPSEAGDAPASESADAPTDASTNVTPRDV
ncbi:hypothetical protein B0I08_104350 [Glaciihabitans tibetensis]|uniref:Uncharacterized protein n=1 Tax=Glaciihabitans tibetensis TaxID=1266600 RepID=A0A2T0VEM5_9MICO|nr:hypothetical protein [Glaciihabitans tibetensis]PRY68646.1 hypothetical protein B0I08_104350 [Glaciihabitans tibetensis]